MLLQLNIPGMNTGIGSASQGQGEQDIAIVTSNVQHARLIDYGVQLARLIDYGLHDTRDSS